MKALVYSLQPLQGLMARLHRRNALPSSSLYREQGAAAQLLLQYSFGTWKLSRQLCCLLAPAPAAVPAPAAIAPAAAPARSPPDQWQRSRNVNALSVEKSVGCWVQI